MRLTERQLRKVIRRCISESYDRGDHELRRSADADDLMASLRGADMPHLQRRRLEDVLDALGRNEAMLFRLSAPANRRKIEAALDRGMIDWILRALEDVIVKGKRN